MAGKHNHAIEKAMLIRGILLNETFTEENGMRDIARRALWKLSKEELQCLDVVVHQRVKEGERNGRESVRCEKVS